MMEQHTYSGVTMTAKAPASMAGKAETNGPFLGREPVRGYNAPGQ
jgi:hypothetical protein